MLLPRACCCRSALTRFKTTRASRRRAKTTRFKLLGGRLFIEDNARHDYRDIVIAKARHSHAPGAGGPPY
jgi:hypothetical protein